MCPAPQASKYYTSDISKASAVYVDDYCLVMLSVGNMHSSAAQGAAESLVEVDPEAALSTAYHKLMEMPR